MTDRANTNCTADPVQFFYARLSCGIHVDGRAHPGMPYAVSFSCVNLLFIGLSTETIGLGKYTLQKYFHCYIILAWSIAKKVKQ